MTSKGTYAKRTLPSLKNEQQCESVDPQRPHLRCLKATTHVMNWHEAQDGEVWRTWIDPARVGIHRRPGAPIVGVTAYLPGDEPTELVEVV